MKVYRLSGVRLDMNSSTYVASFQTIVQQALKLGQYVFEEARKEPFLYYDHIKNTPLQLAVSAVLSHGELFFPELDDKIIGYAAFREIIPSHNAKFEIFLLPEYRKRRLLSDFRDTLEKAAFAPWPEGLQLLKVKATVHPMNISSLKGCKNAGFIPLCESPYEALFGGIPQSMLLLEHYHPDIRKLLKPDVVDGVDKTDKSEEKQHVRRTRLRSPSNSSRPKLLLSKPLPTQPLNEHPPGHSTFGLANL